MKLQIVEGTCAVDEAAATSQSSSQVVADNSQAEISSSIASAADPCVSNCQKDNPEETDCERAHSEEAHSGEAMIKRTEVQSATELVFPDAPVEAQQGNGGSSSSNSIVESAPSPSAGRGKLVCTSPSAVILYYANCATND